MLSIVQEMKNRPSWSTILLPIHTFLKTYRPKMRKLRHCGIIVLLFFGNLHSRSDMCDFIEPLSLWSGAGPVRYRFVIKDCGKLKMC